MIEDFIAAFDEEPGYLDWAAFGPLSPHVRSEFAVDADALGTGRPSAAAPVWAHADDARGLLGELLGFRTEQVTLQPSTTIALQHAVYGLRGGVIASRAEFPSITLPIARAADAFGRVQPQWIEPEHTFVTPDAVADALTTDTAAVVLSAVDFRTGYVADLAAIRDVIGDRLLIVDAIQGFGVLDLEWSVADVVCGNGYKWLRAGRGTGFAAFSDRARERIAPVLSGPSGLGGLVLDDLSAPVPTAQAYTSSPADPLAASRLVASLAELRDTGVASVARTVRERTGEILHLAERYGVPVITPADDRRRAGIVALRPAATGLLAAALVNHGVTATVRGDAVRLSAHAGTGADTLRLLGDVLADVR